MRLLLTAIFVINFGYITLGQIVQDDIEVLMNAIREVTKNEQVTLIRNTPSGYWNELQSSTYPAFGTFLFSITLCDYADDTILLIWDTLQHLKHFLSTRIRRVCNSPEQ